MGALDVVDRAEDLGFSSPRLARIRPFFEDHYVRKGLLPGLITLVARRGRVASVECFGSRDVATGAPVELDTIFRLYSMTKPIVSVALMTLYEQGLFQLDDPVSRVIPEFAGLRVWDDGTPLGYRTTFPEREMNIRDLLTHTSGLTYGFMGRHPLSPRWWRSCPSCRSCSRRDRGGATASPPTCAAT